MELPQNYDHKVREKHWQRHWLNSGVYHWDESASREDTYVIDTPPPTVSGLLHMGHIFSYTQADFIARYQRMKGKTVFYPMGFDDNGLPTERLVEKTQKIRATDMSREEFIERCMKVSEEARGEFRRLFESTALSVDWRQEYHTISEESRRISQMSFLDLFNKGEVYRKLQPMLWDPVDQTAIAQAEIEDKELPSHFNDIWFEVVDADGNPLPQSAHPHTISEGDEISIHFRDGADGIVRSYIVIGTTRPELLPACVAVFYHPNDERYAPLAGCQAITPLFGVKVPILTDDTVEPGKGSGIMMCCTFGDEKDIEKWRKHDLPTRVILNKFGKLDFSPLNDDIFSSSSLPGDNASLTPSLRGANGDVAIQPILLGIASGRAGLPRLARNDEALDALQNLKVSNTDSKHPGARQTILNLLRDSGDLIESRPITHVVKCAERSGAPLEILPTYQWFVKILDKKDVLKENAAECLWHPEWMKLRMDQWIDGLSWDWCISRQRYFGVPFPVWYCRDLETDTVKTIVASKEQLPINPLVEPPKGYTLSYIADGHLFVTEDATTKAFVLTPEMDVMDTWATSSVSPQLSSKGITSTLALDPERHAKLFPADLRPQAHEIIRTWAFYTLVKAELHQQTIPWKNLMISGWCLAADKTKMSKSKGNVVTPVELIEEKGTDAVRYWASTSRLGADTAFSEDALKIGRKLVTKLWNASKFASGLLSELQVRPATAESDIASDQITHTLDKWILSFLGRTIRKATESFEAYEYAEARIAIEDFFWNGFCDNYLELVKSRAYGNETPEGRQSALHAIHLCLNTVLKLFAPFTPHIAEDLFSQLFPEEYAAKGSIHARSMWPDAGAFIEDEESMQLGVVCVDLLNAIRKMKSENNVSIKYPMLRMEISKDAFGTLHADKLQAIEFDLKSAGNVEVLDWAETLSTEANATTENQRFHLFFKLAEANAA